MSPAEAASAAAAVMSCDVSTWPAAFAVAVKALAGAAAIVGVVWALAWAFRG